MHGAHRAQISALLKQVVIDLHGWLIAVAFVVQYLQHLLLFFRVHGLWLPGAFSAAQGGLLRADEAQTLTH